LKNQKVFAGVNKGLMNTYPDWLRAIEQTYIVKFPRQYLATFGVTNLDYFVVTEPIYTAMDSQKKNLETVVRKGKVVAEQPSLITPTYALNLNGFSDSAYEYMKHASRDYGPNSPGILYQYKNQAENLEIVSGIPAEVGNRIATELGTSKNELSVVIVGIDEFWDVALMKFIYEFTASSAAFNAKEMKSRGLFDPQLSVGGLPRAAVNQIDEMFRSVEKGGSPQTLKAELDKWGVFEFYQDRFLNLFR
jgi:hypothetical protein